MQYGALSDTSFNLPALTRPSYNAEIVAETCGACHQDKNDPDGNGDIEEANGIVSEPTYWEWKNSEYSDPQNEHFATCVDCHMPSYGSNIASTASGAPIRDPETIRHRRIEGTTAPFLENAVELTVEVERTPGGVDVDVTIFNRFTGHHVPTGVTVRKMVLVVEAVRSSDNQVLASLGTQNGNGPTFFTDAVGITFDSRIPALGSDTTQYRFAAPVGTGEVRTPTVILT